MKNFTTKYIVFWTAGNLDFETEIMIPEYEEIEDYSSFAIIAVALMFQRLTDMQKIKVSNAISKDDYGVSSVRKMLM